MIQKQVNNKASLIFSLSVLFAILLTAAGISSCSLANFSFSPPSNRYALVIGVQEYQYVTPNLNYPDDDARDISSLLTAQGWNVKSQLIGSDATCSAIETAISTLSSEEDATILIYYSGHGTSLNNMAYILPYDTIAEYTNRELSGLTNAISAENLINLMDSVPAKNRVLILDSCYSGGFTGDANAVDTSPDDYSLRYGTSADTGILAAALANFNSLVAGNLESLGSRDTIALSACGPNEESYDGTASMANGVFTYYLLRAADYGDSDGDGLVTVAEAYAYAKRQIKDNWNSAYYRYDEDFLPHVSGGTGDIALYAPGS